MENVIVIGGGVAGMSAAIYLARAGLKPLVFAGSPPGGQLVLTSEVENYPGYESILGPELVEKMRKQAIKFGTRVVDENIIKVNFDQRPFKLNLSNEVRTAKAIIIATGAKALWLGLESEKRLRGKGVSACATCDGFFFKEKIVAVIGGGDTAMEEALTLSKFAKKIFLIHRRDELRASKIMQERVKNQSKIELVLNSQVMEITGEKKVEGIKIKDAKSGVRNLALDGVFIAIGHKPDTQIFENAINLDDKGYIITEEKNKQIKTEKYPSMTSVSGVFAAGDCVDSIYRQAAVAAGMGVAAALDVEKYLESV